MKYADQIISWGKIKPFFDRSYSFNTIDIETIKNKMFMLGYTDYGIHNVVYEAFYTALHDFLILSLQNHKDILTWTRYDNTHLLKLILSRATKTEIRNILLRVGKITPIYSYKYKKFTFTIVNIIKDSIIFKVTDLNDKDRNIIIYNLKNLYDTDLLDTAKNYDLNYYSKMGEEYHIINKKRFTTDLTYRGGVIESNRLDNIVLLDIAKHMLQNFEMISGKIPKSIFTNGSLARSYLLSQIGEKNCKMYNFNTLFKGEHRNGLLDYSMRSYHGGKIESYILGYLPNAKVIDITSAYPYAMTMLPKMTNRIIYSTDPELLKDFFYAFIKVEIEIPDHNLIHPLIIENPINKSNLSPYGFIPNDLIKDHPIITKLEYDYLIKKGCIVKVIDYYAIRHETTYLYEKMINKLFSERLLCKKTNPSLSQMYKIILNSLYGITYELTDVYTDIDNKIEWIGYRAGEFFMPPIASYITAFTRTYLSSISHNIVQNGGEVYLNMTDSTIFDGECTLDVFSDTKMLGKFETPTDINDVYILGAGRYEYKNDFTGKFTIKNRGFSVKVKDQSFYSNLKLSGNKDNKISLAHRTFVTSFKATTKKYSYQKMGYLIDDSYEINPFNLGGKRIVVNENVNLNKDYTKTNPVYMERGTNEYI